MSNADMAAEISNYSDSVLRAKLMDAGVKPGPIVGSTRALYEKKLLGLLKAANVNEISPKQRRSSPQKPSPHSSFTASPISVGGASPYTPGTGSGFADIPIDGLSGDAVRGSPNSSTPSSFARHASGSSSGVGGLYPRLDALSSTIDQGGLSVSGKSVEHFSTTTSTFGGGRYGGPAGMSHLMEEGVQDFVRQSDGNQDGYGTGGEDSDDMRGEEVFIKHTPTPDRSRPKPYLRPSAAASSSATADTFGRQPSWERTTVTTPRLATPRVYSAANPLDARLAAPSYRGREERHPIGTARRQEVTGRLVNPPQIPAGISPYIKLGLGFFGVVVGVIFMVMLVRRFIEMRGGKQVGDDWEG